MTADEVLLLGVKSRVLAISKRDGRTLWSTELPGSMGWDFVTLLADGKHIFAHTRGRVHCLALENGAVLWSNELESCGYGIASLAFPGGGSAPSPEALQSLQNQQASAAGS